MYQTGVYPSLEKLHFLFEFFFPSYFLHLKILDKSSIVAIKKISKLRKALQGVSIRKKKQKNLWLLSFLLYDITILEENSILPQNMGELENLSVVFKTYDDEKLCT